MEWILKKRHWVSAKPIRPGIFRLKEGGYLIRATVRIAGKSRETTKALLGASLAEAERALLEAKEALLTSEERQSRPLFCDFAIQVLERKVATLELKSAASQRRWRDTLKHLLTALGAHAVDELRPAHLEAWRVELGTKVGAGELSPRTCNGWFSILRVVCKAISIDFELADPSRHLKDFDTSLHQTFTEERPNSLSPKEAKLFLAKLFELYPQHFAMAVLGFCTGLRPSSLRPLRRCGPTPDVLWTEGAILIRRSQTEGVPMERTKTGKNQKLYLPADVFEFLRWHVAQFSELQKESELLFPSEIGGFKSRSTLDRPFAVVSKAIGLRHPITPKAMRRTFNDLARQVVGNNLITRAISGHATETMQAHYSTIRADEQRAAIGNVFSLVDFQKSRVAG